MIPVYLKIHNFLSHIDSEIHFDQLDPITLVIGVKHGDSKKSNGAGKSAIFDAITWALYEKSRASGNASTNIDSIVRNGSTKAEVEFHFRLGESLYRVVRTRDQKRKKSDLTFQVRGPKKWLSAAADTKKATNRKIIKTIGLDYDVFVNTVLLEQNDALVFAHMTSGERKDIVTRILPLQHYEAYGKVASQRLSHLDQLVLEYDLFMQTYADIESQKETAENQLEATEQSIKVHKQRIEALTKVLDDLREQQAKINEKFLKRQNFLELLENIQNRIEVASAGIKDATERTKRYKVEIQNLKDLLAKKRERVLDIKHERGDPGKIKISLERCRSEVEQLEEKHKKCYAKVVTFTDKVDAIQNKQSQIESMDVGKCPTCYHKVTADSKHQVQVELQEEIKIYDKELLGYRTSYVKIGDALANAKEKLIEAEQAGEAFNRLQSEGRILMADIASGKDNLIALEQIYQDTQGHKIQCDKDLVAAQEEKAKILDRIEDLKIEKNHSEHLEEIRNKIVEKSRVLEDARAHVSSLEQEKGSIQERIRSITAIVAEKHERKRRQEDFNLERRAYRELVTAFGKTGIQALILENSAVEIEKIANELLSNISDENVNVQIQTQKPNQDGTFKEVFDILITDEYHSSPFAMYSGGEKFRISFAIRLALSILLTRRAGVKMSAIFYDEAFHDLDDEGADWIMSLFRQLAKDFRHQIVITHDSNLKEQFDDILVVNKTANGSTIVKK